MREVGRRIDADGTEHARVRNVGDYSQTLTLYRRRVGNGTITCRMARNALGVGRRLVQLVAEYDEGGVAVQHVVGCDDELDEAFQLAKLERVMLDAQRRPTPPAGRLIVVGEPAGEL